MNEFIKEAEKILIEANQSIEKVELKQKDDFELCIITMQNGHKYAVNITGCTKMAALYDIVKFMVWR